VDRTGVLKRTDRQTDRSQAPLMLRCGEKVFMEMEKGNKALNGMFNGIERFV